MRRILIDHARGNQAEMRGGGIVHVPLSEELSWVEVGSAELLELDRALDELRRDRSVQGSARGTCGTSSVVPRRKRRRSLDPQKPPSTGT